MYCGHINNIFYKVDEIIRPRNCYIIENLKKEKYITSMIYNYLLSNYDKCPGSSDTSILAVDIDGHIIE